MSTATQTKLGNCFKVALDLLIDFHFKSQLPPLAEKYLGNNGVPKLAHGLVYHEEVGWHVHAWVEDDRYCYDFANGHNGVVDKERYYRLGKCKQVILYSYKAAATLAVRNQTYGCWDKRFDNYN